MGYDPTSDKWASEQSFLRISPCVLVNWNPRWSVMPEWISTVQRLEMLCLTFLLWRCTHPAEWLGCVFKNSTAPRKHDKLQPCQDTDRTYFESLSPTLRKTILGQRALPTRKGREESGDRAEDAEQWTELGTLGILWRVGESRCTWLSALKGPHSKERWEVQRGQYKPIARWRTRSVLPSVGWKDRYKDIGTELACVT